MSELMLWAIVSLDGYFEGPDHEIDWFAFNPELEQYVIDTQLSAGALLFGRKTYEGMAAFWPSTEGRQFPEIAEFMNSVPKVVFSRSLTSADWNNTRLAGQDIVREVAKLKQDTSGEIFIYGSADFAGTLIAHDLVDEYRIGISPVMLGAGSPFFKGHPGRRSLTLVETRSLRSGHVIVHYRPNGTA